MKHISQSQKENYKSLHHSQKSSKNHLIFSQQHKYPTILNSFNLKTLQNFNVNSYFISKPDPSHIQPRRTYDIHSQHQEKTKIKKAKCNNNSLNPFQKDINFITFLSTIKDKRTLLKRKNMMEEQTNRSIFKQKDKQLKIQLKHINQIGNIKESFTVDINEIRNKGKKYQKNDLLKYKIIDLCHHFQQQQLKQQQTSVTSTQSKKISFKDKNSKFNRYKPPKFGSPKNIENKTTSQTPKKHGIQWFVSKINLTEQRSIKKFYQRLQNDDRDQSLKKDYLIENRKTKNEMEINPWSTQQIAIQQ